MWPWVAQLQMPHSNIRSAQSQISLSWSNSNQHTRCFISLQLKEERILGLLVYLDDVIHHPLVACFSDIFKLCKQEQVSLQGSIQYLNHCVAVCSGIPKIVRRKNYLLTEESSSRPRLRVPFAMADRVNWTKCNNIVVAHWGSETRWVKKKCLVVSREFPHYSLTVSLTTKERFQSNLKSRGSVFLLNPNRELLCRELSMDCFEEHLSHFTKPSSSSPTGVFPPSSSGVQVFVRDEKKYAVLFQSVVLPCQYTTVSYQTAVVQWVYKSYCRDRTRDSFNFPDNLGGGLGGGGLTSGTGGISRGYEKGMTASYLDCSDNSRTVRTVASISGSSVTLSEYYKNRDISIINSKRLWHYLWLCFIF